MKFSNLSLALSYQNRAFETTGTSLTIVMMEGYYLLVSNREASRLMKQGYEIFTF
jgi:hypothetical protein